MSAAALMTLLEPAVEVYDRMTVGDLPAVLSGDEPAFMRSGDTWEAVLPRLLVAQPHSRRLLDVPRIRVEPIRKGASLSDVEGLLKSATLEHSPVVDGRLLLGRVQHRRVHASLGRELDVPASMRVATLALLHDMANALCVIEPALSMQAYPDPAANKAFEHCVMALDHLRDLHRGLSIEAPPSHLSRLVPALVPVLEAIAQRSARLTVGPVPDVRVRGSALAFERALINLVTNAVEALSDRTGSIAIAFEDRGATVDVLVEDDGPGVSTGMLARIFDRGFSTKAASGRGEGLANAREDARAVGGDVSAEQRAGGGMVFRLSLPRA